MWDIVGGIAGLLLAIGIYIYWGRKVFAFIRALLFTKNIKKQIEVQQVQKMISEMSEEELRRYKEYAKAMMEKEQEEKRKGIFRA
jgi:hypothetical protein